MTHNIIDNPLTEAELAPSETPLNVQAEPTNKKRKGAQDALVRHAQIHTIRPSDMAQ
jgi:hypothetical protein